MNIKYKLASISIVISFSLIFLSAFSHYTQNHLVQLERAKNLVTLVEVEELKLRRYEKDFIARSQLQYVRKFNVSASSLQQQISLLSEVLNSEDISAEQQTNQLSSVVSTYTKKFNEIVELKQKIGLEKSSGLRKNLRQAAQDAEQLANTSDNQELQLLVLTLRRHEKDFFLRIDNSYLEKFSTTMKLAKALAKESNNSTVLIKLASYDSSFNNIVASVKNIGMNLNDGVYGEMRATINQAEFILDEISTDLVKTIEERKESIDSQSLIYTLVIIVFTLMASFIISRDISLRLGHISYKMSQVARGDGDLNASLSENGNDELTEISKDFNRFTTKLRSSFKDIESISQKIAISTQKSKDLACNTQQNSKLQFDSTQIVMESIEEISESINHVASETQLASKEATLMQQKSSQGKDVVNETGKAINLLAIDITNATNVISTLEENSQQIGTMLEVIKSIAEQTNLLALNAAIEAARAGEAGRGFSVVADEIRSLSQRTQESTAQIHKVIENIQHAVAKTVSSMQQGSSNMETGRQSVHQSTQALDELNEASVLIRDANHQISVTTQQQKNTSLTVLNNSAEIGDLASKTLIAAEDSLALNQELNELSEQLAVQINRFKK